METQARDTVTQSILSGAQVHLVTLQTRERHPSHCLSNSPVTLRHAGHGVMSKKKMPFVSVKGSQRRHLRGRNGCVEETWVKHGTRCTNARQRGQEGQRPSSGDLDGYSRKSKRGTESVQGQAPRLVPAPARGSPGLCDRDDGLWPPLGLGCLLLQSGHGAQRAHHRDGLALR